MSEIPVIAAIEEEKFVLSAMLIREGECIPTVMKFLNVNDFYRPKHRIVFKILIKLYTEGTPPNILSLLEELRKSNDLDNVGIEFAYSLTEYANTTAYVETYSKIIKEKSDLRLIVETSAKITSDAQKGIMTVAEIIDNATKVLSTIGTYTEPPQLSNINDYLDNDFLRDLEEMSRFTNLSTGFRNIDDVQILLPGLYLIGAEPAMGKSTFVWQTLEQMACNGCSCIYCSYEMDKKTMYRKSVARAIFDIDSFSDLTASNLHNNLKFLNHEMTIRGAMNKVRRAQMNLQVLELRDENIDALIRLLKPLCSGDSQPVIAIDYVQIIPSDKDIKASVDESLRKLKVFQRDTNAIIFVVSSFNRTNYRIPVSFASFKESGACEYSADVMWGLQLNVINELTGKEKSIELDEKISQALKDQPRHVHLKCIKNRTGSVYDLFFKYYSANDTFEPCDGFNEYIPDDNGNNPPRTDENYNFEETDIDE